MSFYQEYLKKQNSKKSGKKEFIAEEGGVEKSENETIMPKTDDTPPAMPVQLNSENTQGKFSEMQKAEEKERQDFLKRVKGESILPPAIEKESVPENTKINVPRKPPKSEKVLIRVIVILALIAIIAAIGLLWYRSVQGVNSSSKERTREVIVEEVFVSEAIAPRSLLSYDLFEYPIITRSNEFIPHLLQYMKMETEEEALIKIMFRDQRDPRQPSFINAGLFLSEFSIVMPPTFEEKIDQESLNLFIHSRKNRNEIGFAVIINNIDGFAEMMREWEDNAAEDIGQFLSLVRKDNRTDNQIFTASTYRQNVIRCLKAQDGSEICYTTVREELSNIFIFTTSSDTIRAAIGSL